MPSTSTNHLGVSGTKPRGYMASVRGQQAVGMTDRDLKEWRKRACPVPTCQAKPYQRCYQWSGMGEGKYMIDMARPHADRVRGTVSRRKGKQPKESV